MNAKYLTIAALFLTVNPAGAAEVFSINDALHQAMLTNPAVGEASANRHATQSELRQIQTAAAGGGEVGECGLDGSNGSSSKLSMLPLQNTSSTTLPSMPSKAISRS
jgi:hypothetical protein